VPHDNKATVTRAENQYSAQGDVTFCDSRLVGRHGGGVRHSITRTCKSANFNT
jgi:hypothetical protein